MEINNSTALRAQTKLKLSILCTDKNLRKRPALLCAQRTAPKGAPKKIIYTIGKRQFLDYRLDHHENAEKIGIMTHVMNITAACNAM